MDIDAYLNRINYRGSLEVNAETLRELQVAHLLAVPFENLSIHAEEPIVLEPEALFGKVVHRRRGGFCYELNGLFAALLRELGFEVAMLSARVSTADGGFTPAFDHMALRVTLDQTWLVDVGFGDTFREPLILEHDTAQSQIHRVYKLNVEGETFTLMEQKDGQPWQPQYRFTLKPFEFADFAPRCRFHQTSPDSHFRRGRVCSRATPEGRWTFSETSFIATTFEGAREERTLNDASEISAMLAEHFGVVL